MNQNGRVALITGGLGGIGFATGNMFSEDGYRVLFTDLPKTTQKLHPRYYTYFSCDVRNVSKIQTLFRFCKERFGRLDVLVTAHGIHNSIKCVDAEEKDFDLVMDTNFKSVFFCCREALRLMHEGVIINIGSSVGIAADKDAPVYSVSKAAIHQLTKCLAQEYGRRVRVNAIAPGPIETPLLRGVFNNNEATVEAYRKMALRGIATPEEVARMILFMASDACKFMNGAVVPFDGGESILYAGEPAK